MISLPPLKCPKKAFSTVIKDETKLNVIRKFVLLIVVFFAYFLFIGYQYGLQDGAIITVLTWSFFVLCTPVADAGFLLDFPLRLLFHIRMVYTEIIVWIIAISINLFIFFFSPELYTKTKLLVLFQRILEQPFPFWGIIAIAAFGTFFSILFGDELMDVTHHKKRDIFNKHKHTHRFLVMIFAIIVTFILYDYLLKSLGVSIPL